MDCTLECSGGLYLGVQWWTVPRSAVDCTSIGVQWWTVYVPRSAVVDCTSECSGGLYLGVQWWTVPRSAVEDCTSECSGGLYLGVQWRTVPRSAVEIILHDARIRGSKLTYTYTLSNIRFKLYTTFKFILHDM